jgi:[ribosomal protein S5]-alanine N-acetyltransferase
MRIETARLRLTPATEGDVDVLHRIWTDPDVRRYLWDDIVIDRDVAAAVVAHSVTDWRERGYGLWLITELASDAIAGFAGFRTADERPEPELVFGLLPAYWGRGYATEAAQAALDHLQGAAWAATDPENSASIRVLERLGMHFERRTELLFYRLDRP